MYYSAYGWGVPLGWILFTLYAQEYRPLPNQWNPVIIEILSYRSNWKNHLLFFLLPAGIHVIINCILFIITAIHCNRFKREIHRLQSGIDEANTSTKRKKFIIFKAMFVSN